MRIHAPPPHTHTFAAAPVAPAVWCGSQRLREKGEKGKLEGVAAGAARVACWQLLRALGAAAGRNSRSGQLSRGPGELDGAGAARNTGGVYRISLGGKGSGGGGGGVSVSLGGGVRSGWGGSAGEPRMAARS
jgi:hypothetical protein